MHNSESKIIQPVIYFDSVCGLCNSFVNTIMAWDKQQKYLFAPLQGDTAAERLTTHSIQSINTLVLQDDRGIHIKSDAALRILIQLGGVGKLAYLARIVPRALRDKVYDFVAANRYRWFGKKESCRIPTAAEQIRFLA